MKLPALVFEGIERGHGDACPGPKERSRGKKDSQA